MVYQIYLEHSLVLQHQIDQLIEHFLEEDYQLFVYDVKAKTSKPLTINVNSNKSLDKEQNFEVEINIDYFIEEVMEEDHIEEIFEYFKDSQTDNIHAAIKELGSDFTEEEIRLVRIKFISEMGN